MITFLALVLALALALALVPVPVECPTLASWPTCLAAALAAALVVPEVQAACRT